MQEVIQGDCIEVLKGFDDNTFDSVVTDPPYALSFMGKDWDSFGGGKGYQAWCEEWAAECLRVLKPGGHLLAFGGTRTYHRQACAIEDAGFEIRDSLHWIYGSGFPKSRDISKAIDSEAGAEREVIGEGKSGAGRTAMNDAPGNGRARDYLAGNYDVTAPATEAAKAWAGWGTALKPAHEPIVMARKPLSAKTVAANVLEFGTGGINIDGCRIATDENCRRPCGPGSDLYQQTKWGHRGELNTGSDNGRWPPNVVLTHSPYCELDEDGRGCVVSCPIQEVDSQSGTSKTTQARIAKPLKRQDNEIYGKGLGSITPDNTYGDAGGASRFFPCFKYQAKASRKERPVVDGIPAHPTVKPVALMQWLAKLVTPPGGYVLDPFAGTGTTAEACRLEGFDCLLIERDSDSIRRIEKRMSKYEGVKT